MAFRDLYCQDYCFYGYNNPLRIALNAQNVPKNVKNYSGISINYFQWTTNFTSGTSPPYSYLRQGLDLKVNIVDGMIDINGKNKGIVTSLNGTNIQNDNAYVDYDQIVYLNSQGSNKSVLVMQNEVLNFDFPVSQEYIEFQFIDTLREVA